MKKYELQLRRRASVEEPIKKVHEEFSIFLHEFDKPWGYKGLNVPDVDLSAAELIFVVMLDDLCSRGCKSYISYKLRNKEYLQDNAQYDDYLIIEFKLKDQDFSVFLERVLPSYIRAFNCYRASIINCNLALQDWPEIVEQCNSTGRDINGRDGVYRINEINFFDRELCKRAFNLTPEKIVGKLEGKVESVSLFHDGVILIYSSTLLPQEELEQIDTKVKGWFGCK